MTDAVVSCGHLAEVLEEWLAQAELPLRVETVVVYRAVAADRLPEPAAAAVRAGEVNGVLHFSRRSAVIYLDCARATGVLDSALKPFHYCLSNAVAEPLVEAGAGRDAKFYSLTSDGKKQLQWEIENWRRLSSAVGLLLKRA